MSIHTVDDEPETSEDPEIKQQNPNENRPDHFNDLDKQFQQEQQRMRQAPLPISVKNEFVEGIDYYTNLYK